MYKDDVNVVNIQAVQLSNVVNQVSNIAGSMFPIVEAEEVDKNAIKAYVASADILMTSITAQTVLLQQALDKLAEDLNK